MRAKSRIFRGVWIGVGFTLMAIGLVGAFLPTHLLGVVLVLGLTLVLRNSPPWRRRFIRWKRRHPRFGVPLRRLLRTPPQVAPVVWHELLRTERWVLPARSRRLVRWRRRWMLGRA